MDTENDELVRMLLAFIHADVSLADSTHEKIISLIHHITFGEKPYACSCSSHLAPPSISTVAKLLPISLWGESNVGLLSKPYI